MCVSLPQQDMSDSEEEKSESSDSDEDDETSGSTDSEDDDEVTTNQSPHGNQQLQEALLVSESTSCLVISSERW